jgi:hypothetical protein
MVFTRPILLAPALLLAATAAASAGPLYSASLTNAAGVSNSPTPVTLTSVQDRSDAQHGEGIAFSGGVLAASLLTSKGVDGFNNGLATEYSAILAATYDDILISGPPGGSTPVTLHVPFHAVFIQSYDRMDLSGPFGFTDKSSLTQSADLTASLISPGFGVSQERFNLQTLNDQQAVADVTITPFNNGAPPPGAIQAGPSPGPASIVSDGGITTFRNIPLDSGGFLYLTRTQTPITAPDEGFGPGAGFHFDDIVNLNGEMLLSWIAQVGVPLRLDLSMNLDSIAAGGFQLTASGAIDALHTFGVPQGGVPVFDLPDGFTANSTSLNIVNNGVPAAESAIPEPPAVVLFGAGVLGLLTFSVYRKGTGTLAENSSTDA